MLKQNIRRESIATELAWQQITFCKTNAQTFDAQNDFLSKTPCNTY